MKTRMVRGISWLSMVTAMLALTGVVEAGGFRVVTLTDLELEGHQPPFPRPPVRPNGSFRCLPQKANS